MDPDFFSDYPPHPHAMDLQLPPGYTYLLAKGFSPQQMVLLLQRAKIVLDLGGLYVTFMIFLVISCKSWVSQAALLLFNTIAG